MVLPTLSLSTQPALDSAADVLVLASLSTPDGPVLIADPAFDDIAAHFVALGVTGRRDEVVRLPASLGTAGAIAIVGLGNALTPDALRLAAGSAVRQLTGAAHLAFALPLADEQQLDALLEGALLGAYSFTDYRNTSLAATKLSASRIDVHSSLGSPDSVDHALAIASAMQLVKDLVNTPPSDLFPQTLAERSEQAVRDLPVDVTIWDEVALAADGFGGILGVGQGSTRPPRLVKVSYSPAGASRHLALVGKGITFDTGGLSLKPAASMVGMKYDMTGAATVLAVAAAAAKLALPVRITAWLCIAENMPSGAAIRPEDVLRIRGGRTVEVLNTDAEGRLVLADGLVAAAEEKPDAIVDVATLTGAATVALGTRYFAAMGDAPLVDQVLAASTATGELAWPMPLPDELRALLNSDVADIANAKIGNKAAGMLLAAVFLREFTDTTIPWAHLDIAGSAQNEGGAWGFTKPGPTGVAVRALIRLAEDFSRP
ncbi:leucyl aminopeptidase [Leifsonia kafniensis]|uniref:Probable cytosol aminopeptidase n=1 Tax=Leifsonia kafniensis TaxID=475957 RepID=A0ABP7K7H7_9MICO